MLFRPREYTPNLLSAFRTAFCTLAAAVASSFVYAEPESLMESFREEMEPVLDRYCYDCHGFGSDKGGVVLDGFNDDLDLRDHGLWLRALNNLRTGIMPPSDETQPTEEHKEQIVEWIKKKAFRLDPSNPDPGRVTVRRLNRVEYRNTIKDLLDFDYDTTAEFPADDAGHGFDNMGDVLTISPMLLEKYLDAAQTIVSEVVPRSSREVAERSIPGKAFRAEGEAPGESETDVRRLSYYEPITVSAVHEVEQAGDYQLVVDLMAIEKYVDYQPDLNECRFIFRVDGEVLLERQFVREGWKSFEFVFDRRWEPGAHEVSVEIEPLTPDVERVRNLRLQLNRVVVRGPSDEQHWVQPDDYDRFFPGRVPTDLNERRSYLRGLIAGFAEKAFRRPVDDATIDRLVNLAEFAGSKDGETFESGVSQAMVAILASPRFLFREEGVLEPHPGEIYPMIDEYALASRLSYFLWSTMPDEELFNLAKQGRLREQLEPQVARMLRHPKSQQFVTNFVGQWLQVRDIGEVAISEFAIWLRENPDPELSHARSEFNRIREIPEAKRTDEDKEKLEVARKTYLAAFSVPKPELTRDLRSAMAKESEMVFDYVFRENRSLLELIDSDYTFLNEDLAKHYGIDGVDGEEMRKVELPAGSPRGGVLTQGTVLAVTSNPSRTSPVKRGVFILDNIMGAPPAPPPPDIPSLEELAGGEDLSEMSLRESMALHAKKRECYSCHSRMDPLGLALENFNAMGIWRDTELNQPIDPKGVLITGEEFNDIRDLKRIIANERRKDFYHCMSEKLLTYALGRGLEYYDTATLDQLTEALEQSGGLPSALLMGIIESAPFQKSRPTETIAETGPDSPKLADVR